MTPPDDDLLAPTLSAPPTTSPIRTGVALGAALVVAAVSMAACSSGELPRPFDAGPPRDTGPLPVDAGACDCGEGPPGDSGSDAAAPDAALDASDHPDGAPLDAGTTDV